MSQEDRQIEFEEQSTGLGIARYNRALEKNGEAQMPPGMRKIKEVIDPVAESIREWIKECGGGHAREYATVAKHMKVLEPEVIAYLTAKVCIQAITHNDTVTKVCLDIARFIVDEIDAKSFSKHDRKRFERTRIELKKATSYRHKRTVMRIKAKKAGVSVAEWNIQRRTKVGRKLLNTFIRTAGLIEIYTERVSGKTIDKVRGTKEAFEWFKDNNEACALLTPVYLPMITRPKPWSNPRNGGYYRLKLKLIKTNHHHYLEELAHWDMPQVYQAVNALQDVAWAINKQVFEVVTTVWDGNGCLGGLPNQEPLTIPMKPANWETDKEAFKQWKVRATAIHSTNERAKSKLAAARFQLDTAAMFLDEPSIYFPYTMDWRGRIYPVPAVLNPQGSDVAKAILQFANGKPLGPRGADWLKVHAANLFGVDKVTMAERIAWVNEHREAITDSATNPLDGARFWTTADEPYQALAACIELAGYWREGEGFVSHLPIAMDGSCNGIQNFSAMLRDYEGGCEVNLVPQETPRDIYQSVANVVAKKVEADAIKGVEYAGLWVGKVTRSIVKRPVMTLPYGATRYGMRQQIIEELVKQADEGKCVIPNTMDGDFYRAADYLSWVVYGSIGEVVKAARRAMDWLQEVAKLSAQDGIPINWITPVGLPVLQAYRKTKKQQIQCLIDGRRVSSYLHLPTLEIDKQRQQQGIAPNFVHSMDASHLMLTVNLAQERGVKAFSMVHDSYATHAADADTLAQTLRDTFVFQYQTFDVLTSFRDQIAGQLDETLVDKIPGLPERGNLDLEQVKSSMYFFA